MAIKRKEIRDMEFDKFIESPSRPELPAIEVVDEQAKLVLDDILNQLGGSSGTPVHLADSRVSTPGSEQTVFSFNVPGATTRTLSRVLVTSRQRVKFRVEVNSVQVASGRTAPGKPDTIFEWNPGLSVATGVLVEVFVLQSTGPASDFESYLMATDA